MKKFLVYLCLFAASCLASWFIREQPVEKLAQPEPESSPSRHADEIPAREKASPEGQAKITIPPVPQPLAGIPAAALPAQPDDSPQADGHPALAGTANSFFAEGSHLRIIREVTEEVLDSRILEPDPEHDLQRRITLRKTHFKYPYLIVEESIGTKGNGDEVVVNAEAFVADHLIVNLNPGIGTEEAEARLQDLNCTVMEKVTEGTYLIAIKGPPSIDGHFDKRDKLGQIDEIVEFVEPDYFITIAKMPDDPRLNRLWGINNTGQTGGTQDKDVDGPEAWDRTTGSKEVLAAVIDTGIDRNHEDLKANVWTNPGEIAGNGKDDDGNGFVDDVHGWDFVNDDNNPHDDHSHGTHCAGTIGGVGNNGKGKK